MAILGHIANVSFRWPERTLDCFGHFYPVVGDRDGPRINTLVAPHLIAETKSDGSSRI
jgi:hypothetical protein